MNRQSSCNFRLYKTVILPIVYGCETWSLTLREDHMRMFKKGVCQGEHLDLRKRKYKEATDKIA
jgi:hypothetical protein